MTTPAEHSGGQIVDMMAGRLDKHERTIRAPVSLTGARMVRVPTFDP